MTSKFRHYHDYKLFCRLVKRETEEAQWPIGPRLYVSKMYNQLWNFHDRLVHGSLCIRNFACCNSRLSISPEYVPFTGVIGVGSPVWEWMGGRSPDSPRCCFPVDAGTPSIDRHSGRWHGRNIAKRPGKAAGGVRLGKCNALSAPGRRAGESPCPPSSHIGRHWTIGRRRGRMGTQNSTPVKMQTWGTTAQTSDAAVPYHLDTTLFFVSQRQYAGHGRS